MSISGTKLEVAFKALRSQGYMARANFMCCSGCAGSKVACDLAEKIKAANAGTGKEPKLPTGLVFYHQQDNEAVKSFFEGGSRWGRRSGDTLMIRYGQIDVDMGEGKYVEIGKETALVGADVVKALKDAGIEYTWDGNPNSCIEVSIKSAFVAPVPVLHGRELLMATMLKALGGVELTMDQFMAVYLACDGYGAVNEKFAKAQCFDRSHVRDSSPEAVDRAVALIESFRAVAKAA